MNELAPAKINLCLHLGPLRDDGRHELLSVMQSIDLADALELRDGAGPGDEVRCPGVAGPNLANRAIAAFRERTGWDGPPQLLAIDKRIPIAAGLGGGSADAAATLRLLRRRSGLGTQAELHAIASELGADVPSQLQPGRWLAQGAGERLTRLPDPPPCGVAVLPSKARLSTAAVYAEADRQGLARSAAELAAILEALDPMDPEPVNDLAPAARSLEPTIDQAIALLSGAGCAARSGPTIAPFVTGSGPTVVALFPTLEAARVAVRALNASGAAAIAASPVQNSAST